jgi:hypothetical protein
VSEIFDDAKVFMGLRAVIELINKNAIAAWYDTDHFVIFENSAKDDVEVFDSAGEAG